LGAGPEVNTPLPALRRFFSKIHEPKSPRPTAPADHHARAPKISRKKLKKLCGGSRPTQGGAGRTIFFRLLGWSHEHLPLSYRQGKDLFGRPPPGCPGARLFWCNLVQLYGRKRAGSGWLRGRALGYFRDGGTAAAGGALDRAPRLASGQHIGDACVALGILKVNRAGMAWPYAGDVYIAVDGFAFGGANLGITPRSSSSYATARAARTHWRSGRVRRAGATGVRPHAPGDD
jgi:hypothetical protein